MKPPILFALALLWSAGLLAQEPARQNDTAIKATEVPPTIDFQGRLYDSGGNPVNGSVYMTFTLYDMPAGGSILWAEDRMVVVIDGLFQVSLGEYFSLSPGLFNGPDRWLGIRIGEEAELSPRTKISSVGYAMQTPPASDPTWIGGGNTTQPIGRTGNVGIGTENPLAKLEVAGGDAKINDLTVGKGGGSLLANSALGFSALASNTTGLYNTAVGNAALFNNQDGEKNSAFGFRALFSNTTGQGNTASGIWALFSNTTGSSNVAIGKAALFYNTDRSNLVAVGDSALFNNQSGDYLTAVGSNALQKNTTGFYNTANGNFALFSNTEGDSNSAMGVQALFKNTTGNGNTAIGFQTLVDNSTGYFNTANGFRALFSNTSGNNNSAHGNQALSNNNTGNSNVALGVRALYRNTDRSNLVAVGDSALFHNGLGASYLNDGEGNTAIGSKALFNNTTGFSNTATGFQSLYSNTEGFYNTANGFRALYYNSTGIYNTANGYRALSSNTTGQSNTATGLQALVENTTGAYNTASGINSLGANTTGENNTAFGYYSGWPSNGYSFLTGQKNTFIGSNTTYSNGSIFNSTAIGADVTLTQSNTVILGNQARVGIGTSNPERLLHVYGIGNPRILVESPDQAPELNLRRGTTTHALYVNGNYDLAFYCSGDRMALTTAGNLGIGTTSPGYRLTVNGSAWCSAGTWTGSDIRWKRDITPLNQVLPRVMNLQAVNYFLRTEEFPEMGFSSGPQVGLIAQEVEKIFPQLVSTDPDGFKSIAYDKLSVLLLEAVKEQQAEMETQQKAIDELLQRIEALENEK